MEKAGVRCMTFWDNYFQTFHGETKIMIKKATTEVIKCTDHACKQNDF